MCGRAGDDDSAGELCSVESWTRSCAAIRLGPLRLGVVDVSHLAQLAVALPIALLLIRRSGAVRWARLLPNARARAVAVGPRGDVAIAGEFSNTLVLDGEIVVAIDGEDLFLLGLDAGGAVRWLRGFVSGGDAEVHDLAVDAWGRVTLVASSPLNGGVDFGGPPAPPDLHGFVATFSNDGTTSRALRSASIPRRRRAQWLRRRTATR